MHSHIQFCRRQIKEYKTCCPKKEPYGLAWKVKDLNTLLGNSRKFKVEIDIILDLLRTLTSDLIGANIAHKILMVQSDLKATLSRYKRVAATHVWTVMISPENRQQKPYALPVQCIPYKSLTAAVARCLRWK